MNSIKIKNISKNFNEVKALDNISLSFEEGKIYGLLGRNGAGKSTLLNIISNRQFASSGEVLIDDLKAEENDKALKNVYMMSENEYYFTNLKISQVFRYTNDFYGGFDFEKSEKLANDFGLNTNKKIKTLSTGYKSIFKLIVALCVPAKYILLDEPVLGLDANHREMFYKKLLENYSENPRTFVFSTHLIEEVKGIIEDVIIIKNGQIIQNTSCEELLKQGYTVTGKAADIDTFCSGKKVIGEDTIGGLKTAYIFEKLNKTEVPQNIEVTVLDLQKLFVKLTND